MSTSMRLLPLIILLPISSLYSGEASEAPPPESYENTGEGSPSRESSPETSPRLSEIEVAANNRKKAQELVQHMAKTHPQLIKFVKTLKYVHKTDSVEKKQRFINAMSQEAIKIEKKSASPDHDKIALLKTLWKPMTQWGPSTVTTYKIETENPDEAYFAKAHGLKGKKSHKPLPVASEEKAHWPVQIAPGMPKKALRDMAQAQTIFAKAMQDRKFREAVQDMHDTDSKIKYAMDLEPAVKNKQLLSCLLSINIATVRGVDIDTQKPYPTVSSPSDNLEPNTADNDSTPLLSRFSQV